MELKPGNKVPHYLVSGERLNKGWPYIGTGIRMDAKEFNDRLERSGYAKGNAIDMIMQDFPRKESFFEKEKRRFFLQMETDFQAEWNRIHDYIMNKGKSDGTNSLAYSLYNLPFFEEKGDFPVPYKSTTDMKNKKFKPGELVIIETLYPGWFDDGSDMTFMIPGVIKEPGPDDEDYHLDPENSYIVEFLHLGMEMRTVTIAKDRIRSRK